MKATFNRSALAEALGLLTSVVPSRTPKPILRCVQIVAEEKEVRMCATDLEVGINCRISEVQVGKGDTCPGKEGEVEIPAQGKGASRCLGNLLFDLGFILLDVDKLRHDDKCRDDDNDRDNDSDNRTNAHRLAQPNHQLHRGTRKDNRD